MEAAEQQLEGASKPQLAPGLNLPGLAPNGQQMVSVEQLRHPLTRKGRKLLQKVESYLRLGQRDKAIEQLAVAIHERSAAPYAHGILGTEYLRTGHARAAIPELEEAARVLPIAGVHSNLAYALCLTGQSQRGEQELQEALRLDGGSPQARFLMGVLLLGRKSRDHEARYDLKMALKYVPSAHLALAVCHLRDGENEAAQKELRQYLGPAREIQLPVLMQWASAAAARPDPATAFGLRPGSTE